MGQLNIFQPRFASVQAQVTGKGFEGLAIDCQFVDLHFAAALQVAQSTGGPNVSIYKTGEFIIRPAKGLHICHIFILDMKT